QAEDGIRDRTVTGVQTCALPICRAVSYANFGKLRFKTEYDQPLGAECRRLLTNCLIYSNATILSHLFTHTARHGDAAGAALLTRSEERRVGKERSDRCGGES